MGRPRTIVVDEQQLLVGIAKEFVRVFNELLASAPSDLMARYELDLLRSDGVPYSLTSFAGHDLSPSECIRHQQAIRRLADQGLAEIYGARASRIALTPEGWLKAGTPDPFTSKPKRKTAKS